jgi:hypothetical protein
LAITWTQSEQLNAREVELDGLRLAPTRYEEQANDDGSITIAMQATLSADDTDRLRELVWEARPETRYRTVIRHGISEVPRSMRFGRVLWQQLGDGQVAHDITLVDEAYDRNGDQSAFAALSGEPQVGNLIQYVTSLTAQLDALLAELARSGALDEAAVQRVRESASEANKRQYDFFKVGDLSKW